MQIEAKRLDDIEKFVDALQSTGVFYDVIPKVSERNDDGSYRSDVISFYLPAKGTPVPGKPPATAKPAGKGRP